MTIGVLCCQVMEKEVRTLLRRFPDEFYVEVLEWGLHVHPPLLLNRLVERIRAMEDRVTAVVLAFGRCQTLDKLPEDFKIPVLYPPGEDCIGVLLGQERYLEELYREAGTWFLTPGWAELGMTFIFSEIQASGLAKRGIDPMTVARRMLEGYKRVLLIDTGAGDTCLQRTQAQNIADLFGWRVDTARGSMTALETVFQQALTLSQGL
ncbi:MAG: DUF1638 domain-containing protein [Desulfatirhabdiaceae bacterium]